MIAGLSTAQTSFRAEPFLSGNSAEPYGQSGIINGVSYAVAHLSASAKFAGQPGVFDRKTDWIVACRKDPIQDIKSCTLISSTYDFGVTQLANGMRGIVIGSDHYPRSTVAIRIDAQPPHISEPGRYAFSGQRAEQILTQLVAGKEMITRYTKWPNNSPVDTKRPIYGLPEALQFLPWAIENIQ